MDMDNPGWINEALIYFGGDEMKAIELKITDEDYEYLRWLEEKEEEELPTLAKKLLHRIIKANKERIASEMFGEGKISFLESCEMVKAAPSEMIGILIKNGVKIGSELIPPDIGLKNLREYWKHFFFLEKRKPVLKEK